MAPRSFRFHVVRMETCRKLLYRVHRYLLKSAMIVCLMEHTAVQTSVAQSPKRFTADSATADPSEGRRHGDVRIGEPGDPTLRFSSRLLFVAFHR